MFNLKASYVQSLFASVKSEKKFKTLAGFMNLVFIGFRVYDLKANKTPNIHRLLTYTHTNKHIYTQNRNIFRLLDFVEEQVRLIFMVELILRYIAHISKLH